MVILVTVEARNTKHYIREIVCLPRLWVCPHYFRLGLGKPILVLLQAALEQASAGVRGGVPYQ
jgi:hypothetical protein